MKKLLVLVLFFLGGMFFAGGVAALEPLRIATKSPKLNLEKIEEQKEKLATRTGIIARKMALFAEIKGNIQSINGTALVVDGKTINTNAQTKLIRKFGGASSLSEFSVGNTVLVRGTWTDDGETTINAYLIRNMSIQKRHGVFFGKITALKSETAEFTIETLNRGSQLVIPGKDTKYVNRKMQTITFTDLKIGDTVRVKGLWDNSLGKISEVVQVKDFSLPMLPSAN